MHVGVPSLLASVVMFCYMCNRPSAKVLCAYASVARVACNCLFTECILYMHKGVLTSRRACSCTLCQLCGQIETDGKWSLKSHSLVGETYRLMRS